MSTSGTYDLNYEIAEFVDEAFERAGVDPTTLVGRHARTARRSLNLMFADWATYGVLDFVCEKMTNIYTAADDYDYLIPDGTLAIIAPVLVRSSVSTPIHMISREDWQNIPDKTQTGLITQMFFDRPTLTAYTWPAGENATDVISYWRLRRVQDVSTAAETPDVPYHWYEALASGLAEKLALKYNPNKFSLLKGEARGAFNRARDFDRVRAPTSFMVSML